MKIKCSLDLVFILVMIISLGSIVTNAKVDDSLTVERLITVIEYRDKMMAGWIGQMAGVGWGASTEFRYLSRIIPEDEVPEWSPEMVNVFNQDDLYVEMTFLRSMEEHGFDVSQNQAGIDFANSAYMLWVANEQGRKNLRNGIAPPNSGHPKYNKSADAIDYQIEADFSGLISPGLPNTVIALGEKFGRLMNYGDGVYGGQFVGGMYAEAFFETDPAKIVEAGLKCIPEGSQYAQAVRDVVKWHEENPDDWETTWELINKKYHEDPYYRQFTYEIELASFNIDAKLNGAYIVIGLLYGNGDPDLTTIISMRCGQDSDCNPSNALGILFTSMGYDNLDERFISGLDNETKFSFTEYTMPALIDISEKLAVQAVKESGGRIEKGDDGEDVLIIPVHAAMPGDLLQSHEPGPLSDNVFTSEELSKIEGSKIYTYALVFIVLIAFFIFKENYSMKASAIFIPLIGIIILLEVVKYIFFSTSTEINVINIVETFTVVIAVYLLIGERIKSFNPIIKIVLSVLIIIAIGYASVIGDTEGRYIASSYRNLIIVYALTTTWLISIIITAGFTKTKYSRKRFNLILAPTLFVTNLIGFFLVTVILFNSGAKSGMISDIPWLLGGAFAATFFQYLITVPFLILTYKDDIYGGRLNSWLKIS